MTAETPEEPVPPIETPAPQAEEPELEVEYGGFQRRNMAMMVDVLIILVVLDPVMKLFYTPRAIDFSNPEWANQVHADRFFTSFILPGLVYMAYSYFFWVRMGASPGKKLLSMRIVDAKTLQKPKKWQYIVRTIGYGVPGLVAFIAFAVTGVLAHATGLLLFMLVSMLGFLWIALDPNKRGWHDYMARTVVVWDRKPLREQFRQAMLFGHAVIEKIKKHTGR